MTIELAEIIFGGFLYFVFAGAVSLKFEAMHDFDTPVAMLIGVLWPLAIPFFLGVEWAARFFQPPTSEG